MWIAKRRKSLLSPFILISEYLKVFLNGQELSGIHKGYTDVHYIIDNVTLADGKNIVKTVASKDGKTYEDTIEWMCAGEENGKQIPFPSKVYMQGLNKKQHTN